MSDNQSAHSSQIKSEYVSSEESDQIKTEKVTKRRKSSSKKLSSRDKKSRIVSAKKEREAAATSQVKSEYVVDSDDAASVEGSKVKRESKKYASLLKKRTRKESKMAKCDYLDFEADESDHHEDRKSSRRRSVKFDDQVFKRGK